MFERIAPEQHDTLDGVPDPAETLRLYGHECAVSMLTAIYRAGKLPHALILAGPVGIGKATLAFHLARYLLRNPDHRTAPETFEELDPSSSLFHQVASGAHPGVLHLTRSHNDKNNGFKTVLTVDEIRKVSHFLSMTSHDGSYRLVIVDSADDMNTNAANALLKNLEEPPKRTLFIVIVHVLGSLLPTISSRCQTIRLTPLDYTSLVAALTNTDYPAPDEPQARATLVERSGGSVRDAILLTQYGGLEIADTLDKLVSSGCSSIAEVHKLADTIAGRDSAIQFEIFNRQALNLLADSAAYVSRNSELGRANAIAEAWQDAQNAIFETETYNLDKKQHVLAMIDRLNAVMRM